MSPAREVLSSGLGWPGLSRQLLSGVWEMRGELTLKYLRLKVFAKAYSCLIELLLCLWISVVLPHREFKHNINMYLNELRRKLVVPSPVLIRYVLYKKHINADFCGFPGKATALSQSTVILFCLLFFP